MKKKIVRSIFLYGCHQNDSTHRKYNIIFSLLASTVKKQQQCMQRIRGDAKIQLFFYGPTPLMSQIHIFPIRV